MTLSELVRLLAQHGVSLSLTQAGKLRPQADTPPPADVLEGIKRHRAALVRRLERGQTPAGEFTGHYLPGQCGTCAHWAAQPSEGPHAGACALDWAAHYPAERHVRRHVITHGHSPCAASNGTGWAA